MKRQSAKTRKRERECREFREALIRKVFRCEIHGWPWFSDLVVHEIARGPNRLKALDKPFAMLVVCGKCHLEIHAGKEPWPEARQLAVLKRSRPDDLDLPAYNKLVGYGPNRIADEDLAMW